jgi:hypothetical protein
MAGYDSISVVSLPLVSEVVARERNFNTVNLGVRKRSEDQPLAYRNYYYVYWYQRSVDYFSHHHVSQRMIIKLAVAFTFSYNTFLRVGISITAQCSELFRYEAITSYGLLVRRSA